MLLKRLSMQSSAAIHLKTMNLKKQTGTPPGLGSTTNTLINASTDCGITVLKRQIFFLFIRVTIRQGLKHCEWEHCKFLPVPLVT